MNNNLYTLIPLYPYNLIPNNYCIETFFTSEFFAPAMPLPLFGQSFRLQF
jgi:hypothetical protein